MNAIHTKLLSSAFAFITVASLAGCSGMSRAERTAVGAATRAVGGAVLTDGHPAGVIGGAAVGGVIGHQSGDDDRRRHRHYRH